ncbi:unnamed protein product, partial [Prorocentrum cordatum]
MSARQTEVLGSPVGRTASMTPSALQGVSPFFPEGAGGVERRPSGPLQPGQAQPQIVMCHFGDPGQPFQLHRLDDATPASAIRPGAGRAPGAATSVPSAAGRVPARQTRGAARGIWGPRPAAWPAAAPRLGGRRQAARKER